jgi:hypothetical protein
MPWHAPIFILRISRIYSTLRVQVFAC